MRDAKCLANFFQSAWHISCKANYKLPGQLFQKYVYLSVAQFCVWLFEITIKASDLWFAAKCRH